MSDGHMRPPALTLSSRCLTRPCPVAHHHQPSRRVAGSDWHIGSRVMMTLALILLFFLEFVLLGYVCIKRLEPYRSKLVAFVIGLSVSAGNTRLIQHTRVVSVSFTIISITSLYNLFTYNYISSSHCYYNARYCLHL